MILVCGEALYDVFPRGEAGAALKMEAYRGGSPYNVAIGLARLGSETGFFGGFSDGPLGAALRASLDAEGVDTTLSPDKSALTTLSLVQLDASGSPHYAFYGEGMADRLLTPADLPTLPDSVKALHFGSFSLVVEPCGSTLLAFAKAQSGQRLIAYDPNVRPTVEPDMALWRSKLGEWLQIADMVKVSQEDLSLLYPGRDPLEIARNWLHHRPALVVVTRSEEGAVALTAGGKIAVPSPAIEMVDAVGAGDAFQAGLLRGLELAGRLSRAGLKTLTPEALTSALRLAVAVGAKTCTRAGADLPRAAELAL
ncbi:carbohydrate kinase family protein [Acidocella aminolytica]|jgi:fructokinase|uniref:Fructokinase n=1 Tax=Acidocella aminolytica 101 = DSM 11237 TaxID=1120923 RepID=A0A0D6PKG4_9PROT|nr:carbohydrate kinase [Acidocella aminolytica]GAN81936.1 fructokinase [Acidocella aminolytica 101 = DSM 11237]GBQ38544.1 fructokinase [Acidocella aminolytica 101 = DSM 11237]SHE76658.1 fructokinase [Acidocella aminolytica 101 = DSM 11237]